MRGYRQAVKQFLSSPEATASAFSTIGWDTSRTPDGYTYWCLVNYGLLEEMELDVVLQGEDQWFAEMWIPPILARYEQAATRLADDVGRRKGLAIAVDTDRSVILGALGEGDPVDGLRAMWQSFADPEVYDLVLLLCGMTAPTEEDAVSYDVPDDNPFWDEGD